MITHAGAWRVAPAEPGSGDDPFSMFAGWDSSQLVWLAILVPVAVLVFFVGSKRFRAQLGASRLSPRGRDRFVSDGGGRRRDAPWRATVEQLRARVPAEIATAPSGTIRIEAEIVGASGNLGGAAGRECVWRNRAGAGPSTAVAAEIVFVADGTGRCGVEGLEAARVQAPVDKTGAHYESVSLQIGDRVEIIANFARDVVGEHDDPTRLVYGTLGTDGHLDIRVLDRPAAVTAATPPPDAIEQGAESDDPDDEP